MWHKSWLYDIVTVTLQEQVEPVFCNWVVFYTSVCVGVLWVYRVTVTWRHVSSFMGHTRGLRWSYWVTLVSCIRAHVFVHAAEQRRWACAWWCTAADRLTLVIPCTWPISHGKATHAVGQFDLWRRGCWGLRIVQKLVYFLHTWAHSSFMPRTIHTVHRHAYGRPNRIDSHLHM